MIVAVGFGALVGFGMMAVVALVLMAMMSICDY